MRLATNVCGLVHGKPLDKLKDIVNELELGLVTVQDVIDRYADGAPAEGSYIGVNLGLYVEHTQAVLMQCWALIREGKIQKDG